MAASLKGNDFRPRKVRERRVSRHERNIQALILCVLVLELGIFAAPALTSLYNENAAAVLPGALATLTNEERKKSNLATLQVNALLSRAAELKAQDMAENSYFAHTSPDGKEPWYWLDRVGYEYDYAGENLAMNFENSEDVTRAWMKSPTHHANIVKGTYSEVGTGVAVGEYEGAETTFVVQVYARPQGISAPEKEETPARQVANVADATQETEELKGGSVVHENERFAATEATTVLGTEIEELLPPSPTFWERALVSPKHVLGWVVWVIVLGLVFVLVLRWHTIRKCGRPQGLITNALAILLVLLSCVLFAGHLSRPSIESKSVDYKYGDTQRT